MGFVPLGFVPPRKPETLEPPGMFEALLEEIEVGRISAKEAAIRYADNTLARTIHPTEQDARILRNRAHLNAMIFDWPGEWGREVANNYWLLHHIPDTVIQKLETGNVMQYTPPPEYDTVCLIPYPE